MADFYIRSAVSLDRVLRDECSVKAVASPHPDSTRVLAILINSLAYRNAIMHALDEAKVLKLEERVFTLTPSRPKPNGKGKEQQSSRAGKEYPSKEAFLLILTHDLLFQTRGIQAAKTWPPKVTLEKYRASIHSSLVKLQLRQGKARITDLRSGALYHEMVQRMPRWVRINPLRATRDQVLSWLQEHHYKQLGEGEEEISGVKEWIESKHVPGLLAFHPKATSALLASEMYKQNWIVMQDLASCFPAFILDPPGEAEVVDATSAPGNKTSHLSAIMLDKSQRSQEGSVGKVYAFERDAMRFKTLIKRLAAVGALANDKLAKTARGGGNVIPERKDFLTTKPSELARVTHMLLDPSCSGSGIVNRLDFLKEDDDVEDPSASDSSAVMQTKLEKRLFQLSEFQLLMIRHAFKFPSLRKIVYSTCSIHAQENEEVVLKALSCPEAADFGWTLAPREMVIPSWPVRGEKKACKGREDVRDAVIRCVPGGTGKGEAPNVESCNGFFVACFVREEGGSKRKVEAASEEEGEPEEAEESDQEGKKDGQEARGAKSAANRKKKLQKKRKKQRLEQQQ